MTRFALIGAAGYIAPKHLAAIKSVGGELVAAVDPHDSVGVLDQYFPNTRFFPDIAIFDRYLEKCLYDKNPIDYVVVCSPNYLHVDHARMAMRAGCDVICEKPLVLHPRNLDQLQRVEKRTGRLVHPVMQLRYSDQLQQLREQVKNMNNLDVHLKYVTRRGPWYQRSWKGNEGKSGGVLLNIGIHLFDLLLWIFGPVKESPQALVSIDHAHGVLRTERAVIRWELSVRAEDLPDDRLSSWRFLDIDGMASFKLESFGDLHSAVYAAVLAGNGMRIEETRPAIELVTTMRARSSDHKYVAPEV